MVEEVTKKLEDLSLLTTGYVYDNRMLLHDDHTVFKT